MDKSRRAAEIVMVKPAITSKKLMLVKTKNTELPAQADINHAVKYKIKIKVESKWSIIVASEVRVDLNNSK